MRSIYLCVIAFFFCANVSAKDGVYLEFKITSSSMNGVSKSYCSGGDTRSEMTMNAGGGFSVITLLLNSTPNTVYMLNDRDKTYSEMSMGQSQGENSDRDDYDVTVVGNERVNNYNSVHIKVKNKRTQKVMDMWLSKDIADYSRYTDVKSQYLGGSGFFNKLKEKGADGFVVRMLVNGEGKEKLQMDLVKAERRDINAALLSLAGYKKSVGAQMPGGYTAPSPQDIQNMTPEQRQQYIQQMQQRYQQQQR
ncbi:MAG: hypothetical protein K0Q79_1598 [Flavipsychrobacter sp.]|jgi:hypothetical protein|nr:hypothetical protein [Flavipsychrobacter sp.]